MNIYFVCQETPSGIENEELFFDEDKAQIHFDLLYQYEEDNPRDYQTRMFVFAVPKGVLSNG